MRHAYAAADAVQGFTLAAPRRAGALRGAQRLRHHRVMDFLAPSSPAAALPTRHDSPLQSTLQRLEAMRQARIAQLTGTASGASSADTSIAARLSARLGSLMTSERNVAYSQSLTQVADGALSTVSDTLQQMRDLAVQAGDGALSDADRRSLQKQYDALAKTVPAAIDGATFNGRQVFGRDAGTLTFQVGAGSGETLDITTPDLTRSSSIHGAVVRRLGSAAANAGTMDALDAAMKTIDDQRASLGAAGARLQSQADRLDLRVTRDSATYQRLTAPRTPAPGPWTVPSTTALDRELAQAQWRAALMARAGSLRSTA
jgi:flagellin